ncbi:hypothetical protein AVEN_38584-1 [Araneus ventricosus]|uniref:Uncharacterized protein n=1 Tax=Araneus ventricosus TaxID=182803 RepID=A0A4Y2VQL5_ARAVE|nr:hypothetical protein AVEN_38584-1 [Araneus ventricosus]
MSKMKRLAPPTSTTPDNIERVRRMLADDRRLSLRMIVRRIEDKPRQCDNIIHEHLQKCKKRLMLFRHWQIQQRVTTVLRVIPERSVC